MNRTEEDLLNNLMVNCILEGYSDNEARIVCDLDENKEKIAQIAGKDFEILWQILQQSQNKKEQ